MEKAAKHEELEIRCMEQAAKIEQLNQLVTFFSLGLKLSELLCLLHNFDITF